MPTLRQAAKKLKNYDTPLDPAVKADYDKLYPPEASRDYDMQGWYDLHAQTPMAEHRGHYVDTFKKPNHPTFSNESKYSNAETPGGVWFGENFMPSDQQLNTPAKVQRLKDYWNTAEPGFNRSAVRSNQLLLPAGK